MKIKNYRQDTSLIDWNKWFIYDEKVPSCLRWKVDRYKPNGIRCHILKGKSAGRLDKNMWDVGFDSKIYRVHRIIWEMHYGNIEDGFVIDHIDGDSSNNKLANLRCVSSAVNSRNMSQYSSNKTGVTGVCRQYKRGYPYYIAQGNNLDGTRWQKTFSIHKLGEDVAFNLACSYRKNMIEKLNTQGANYSERHGTTSEEYAEMLSCLNKQGENKNEAASTTPEQD